MKMFAKYKMKYQQMESSSIYIFMCVCVCVCVFSHFSHLKLFVTLWTVACQAPLSMGFCRQEYWSGLPCPPPGNLPDPGIRLASQHLLHYRQILYLLRHPGSPYTYVYIYIYTHTHIYIHTYIQYFPKNHFNKFNIHS